MTRLHLVILCAAARLVPEGQRAEWLAEWTTELWYAMQESNREGLTAFCLGAFSDALWKRRHAPIARNSSLLLNACPCVPEPPLIRCAPVLGSPMLCIGAFACLAALSFLPGRVAPVSGPSGGQLFLVLLPFCAVYSLVMMLTGSSLFGEYPRHRNWTARWSFFLAKLALLIFAVAFGASAIPASEFRVDVAMVCTAIAARWATTDQLRRCPVCLHILENPIRMGNHSRILLEWNGTELLCLRGHGVMHVPEQPAIWFTRQRWLPLM
jgi:hypothetical protein